jgi:SagB-type dehydrogenase family enzyme
MDWANQPDPFRRYEGARRFILPFRPDDPTPAYDDVFRGPIPAQPVNADTIALFFEQSLGISAHKSHAGSHWKLRCNPSSGNLHPTESYLIAGPIDGLSDTGAVYHYMPEDHAFELRAEIGGAAWQALMSGFLPGTFFVGLSSIHWREAWKYGERAFRYCHHDMGHAIGALVLSAASLGWRGVMLESLGDSEVGVLLGLETARLSDGEPEYGECVFAFACSGEATLPNSLASDVIDDFGQLTWHGDPNKLSEDHVEWSVIPETAEQCRKPRTDRAAESPVPRASASASGTEPRSVSAGTLFRQRRSAVAFDGATFITREVFCRMLAATMPFPGAPPFDTRPYAPRIDLALFVHRVNGLSPGIYAFVRDQERVSRLRESMRTTFAWSQTDASTDSLPLYCLAELDCRTLAMQVSCLQDIAGDGAFSLGMIAEFEAPLREFGAWYYPRLFWEAGLVGQVLYLEAEAADVRATGIGCYFDDAMHDVLGLQGHAFQSMYHFTVGGPVDDPRITGLAPYDRDRRLRRGWVD